MNSSPEPFSLQDAALLTNISIEASAGTGKTYTLEQIVCHLLEYHGVHIKQILLLTYTDKAASELRERIRSRLSQRYAELRAELQKDSLPANSILMALNQFHEASISTIHSFCRRCLELYPLEVGRPVAISGTSENSIDPEAEPIRELLLDELQSYDAELEDSLVGAGELLALNRAGELDSEKILDYCSVAALQNFWQREPGHPGFTLYPGEAELGDFEALERDFAQEKGAAFAAFRQLAETDWPEEIFSNRASKKKLKNLPPSYKAETALAFFGELKSLLELQAPRRFRALLTLLQVRPILKKDPYLAVLQCLAPAKLANDNNDKFEGLLSEWVYYDKALMAQDFLKAFPPYLKLAHSLEMLQASYLARFLLAMRDKIYPKLQLAKSLYGTRSFNDMIEDLYKVLVLKESGDSATLLALLRKQYRTVLVDEFQDTDPIQWQIIYEIFGRASGALAEQTPPKRSHNFIIVGDPKQSIYGFRGVNRQLYQEVQQVCDFRYRLGANYRSNSALVEACNQVFQRVWQDPAIFEPVSPVNLANLAKDSSPPVLQDTEAAFTFLDCDSQVEEKSSHTDLRQRSIEVMAQKVGQLLGVLGGPDGCQIVEQGQERKLVAGDIAVLLRQKKDGQAMQARLRELGIATQFREARSVFADPCAQALEYFLLALCQPRQLEHSMRLLLSPFFDLGVLEVQFLLQGKDRKEEQDPRESASPRSPQPLRSPQSLREFAQVWLDKLTDWKQEVDKGYIQAVLEDLFLYGSKIDRALQGNLEGGFENSEHSRQDLRQHLFCRILSQKNGTQSYGNLRHLVEVLSSEQLAGGLDCRGLCEFVSRQVKEGKEGKEGKAYEQRSNQETQAVQIMTIHTSKGLEFPVVLLGIGLETIKDNVPYLKSEFRQEKSEYRQSAHLVLEESSRKESCKESCAELRRLLYVGLTRASAKLYFPFHSACPKKKDVPYRAIVEEILGRRKPPYEGEDALFANFTEEAAAPAEEIRAGLDKLVAEFPQLFSIELPPLFEQEAEPETEQEAGQEAGQNAEAKPQREEGSQAGQAYRKLKKNDLQQRFAVVSSFSSLQPPNIAGDIASPALEPREEWHELWLSPGARLGNLLHNLLESCDYQWIGGLSIEDFLASETWYEEVSVQSRSYFPRDWVKEAYPALCRMIWGTLHRDLALSAGLSKPLRLCELRAEQRRHEVEFLLQIPRDSSLQAEQFLLSRSGRVEISQGFLKGFIDLLFVHDGQIFLLDWKSNIQHASSGEGSELEQIREQLYAPEALKNLMDEHSYTMQYLIYLSVIYYYLKMQHGFVYESDFGGCYYLFLRGSAALKSEAGIFFHKPEEALIEAILRQLGL